MSPISCVIGDTRCPILSDKFSEAHIGGGVEVALLEVKFKPKKVDRQRVTVKNRTELVLVFMVQPVLWVSIYEVLAGVRFTIDHDLPESTVLRSAPTSVQEVFPDGHWSLIAVTHAVEFLVGVRE